MNFIDYFIIHANNTATWQFLDIVLSGFGFTGCLFEVDKVWNITWPPTEIGEVTTQKCPGGSEVIGM